jgi:multidrug resistance efflux pump
MPLSRNPSQVPAVAATPAIGWQAFEREDASRGVREILGRTPRWILRSGTTVVAAVVGVLLFLSWLIHYPDTVAGKVTITGAIPALEVVARQSGQLERLCVREGEPVKKGRLLGVIKNPADTDRVLHLKDELQQLRAFLVDAAAFVPIDLAGETEMGVVQGAYSDFHSRYQLYRSLLRDDYSEKTLASLQQQFDARKAQLVQMQRQSETARREGALARESFERMRQLHGRDSISTAEFQQQERQLLEQSRQQSTIEKAMLEEEVAVTECEKQIRDLSHKRSEDLRVARSELSEAFKKLLAAIEIWENDFVLRAPTDGTVAFYDFWADQQFVTQGKSVFIIAPEITQLLGRMPVLQGGAGKVKPGQVVNIRLNDYPSREFGMATGKVKSVSLVAQQGQQLVSFSLEYPIVTTYKKRIAFKQEMVGEARIITDDRRLLERLFGELRKVWSQPAG